MNNWKALREKVERASQRPHSTDFSAGEHFALRDVINWMHEIELQNKPNETQCPFCQGNGKLTGCQRAIHTTQDYFTNKVIQAMKETKEND